MDGGERMSGTGNSRETEKEAMGDFRLARGAGLAQRGRFLRLTPAPCPVDR
jgi:hypothetical protein